MEMHEPWLRQERAGGPASHKPISCLRGDSTAHPYPGCFLCGSRTWLLDEIVPTTGVASLDDCDLSITIRYDGASAVPKTEPGAFHPSPCPCGGVWHQHKHNCFSAADRRCIHIHLAVQESRLDAASRVMLHPIRHGERRKKKRVDNNNPECQYTNGWRSLHFQMSPMLWYDAMPPDALCKRSHLHHHCFLDSSGGTQVCSCRQICCDQMQSGCRKGCK